MSAVAGRDFFFPSSVKKTWRGRSTARIFLLLTQGRCGNAYSGLRHPFFFLHMSIGLLCMMCWCRDYMSSRWDYCSSCFIPCSWLWVMMVLVLIVWWDLEDATILDVHVRRIRAGPFVTAPRRRTVRVGTRSSDVLVWCPCSFTGMHRSM